MIDFVYVGTTVLFFGLMILYVVGCDRLGRTTDVAGTEENVP